MQKWVGLGLGLGFWYALIGFHFLVERKWVGLVVLELNIVTLVYDVMSVWFVRMLSVVYIMYMHMETI